LSEAILAAGACKQRFEARCCRSGVKLAIHGDPQDLHQRSLQFRRCHQGHGIRGFDGIGLGKRVQRTHRIAVKNQRRRMPFEQLKRLGDELDIDKAAARELQVPWRLAGKLREQLGAHIRCVGQYLHTVGF